MSIVTRTASRQTLRRRFFPYDLHHLTALRNTMPPANNTPLTFHHAIARDIPAIFKMYERDEHYERLRLHAFERLRNLVQAIGSSGEYDLVDNSFSTLQDSPRFYNAPLECTIVDKMRPEGISPEHGDGALPVAYDAIALAKYLSEHGYSGTFIDTKPDLLGYNATDATALHQPALLQPEPAWGELSTPFSSLFNVLPPILRIKPETTEHPEIHLSPSHPSHQLRWDMLKRSYESSAAFRMLSSFFWLWLRAQGLEHHSWTTCAFLVMYYLQAQHKLPSPPVSDAQSTPQEIWNRIECRHKLEYERLVVPHAPHVADPPDLQGSLLFSFFSFWDCPLSFPYNQLLDPLHGTCVAREGKYRANGKDLDETQVMKDLRKRSGRAGEDAFWCYNPLVLIDPFLSQHNLAHTVTKHALCRMFYNAHLAVITLKTGLPVIELLASREELSSEARETDGVSSKHRAPTLPFSLRRLYHSLAEATKDPLPEIRAPPEVPQTVRRARWQTINRVNTVIRKRYGTKYSIVCFGSTHYGVDSPTSDLDLVVLDADRKDGFRPGVASQSLPAVYNVRGLAQTLGKRDFHVIQVIPTASVPIVKFEDPRTGLACDINVNDRLGLYNTRLIAQYCALSPLLRPMLVLLKKWAKSLGLNNPAGTLGGAATFSSYSLTLMTIGFFQTHDVLPNLQAGLPPFEEQEAFWLRDRSNRIRCDPRFNRLSDWTSSADTSICDLREGLSAWFRFWGHQFAYSKDVMSIRDGGVVPRSAKAEATVTEAKQRKHRAGKREKKAKQDRKLVMKLLRRERDGEVPLKLEELTASQLAILNELVGIPDASVAGESSEMADAAEEESVAVDDAPAIDAPVADDPDAVALEKLDETDLQHGKQPRSWSRTPMVIADPFIVSKNATMNITVRVIERFTAECRRALLLLTAGAEFEEVLGDGSLIPGGGRQQRGRRDRAGRRSRGRSRSKSPKRSSSKKRSKSKGSTGSKSKEVIRGG